MECWGITLSGVWRGGALDRCAKKAHHPLWTVLVYSSTPKRHIQHWKSLARSGKTRDCTLFFTRFIQILRVTRTRAGLWPR